MTMIGPEFPAVLDAATRGDEEAVGRLWGDLQPRLLRYFMVGVPGAAEDLAPPPPGPPPPDPGGRGPEPRALSGARSRRSGPGCSPSPAMSCSTGGAARH